VTRHATACSRVTVARRGRGSAPVVALALAGWAMPPSVEFPRRSAETVYGMAITAEEIDHPAVAPSPRRAAEVAVGATAHRAPATTAKALPNRLHRSLARSTASGQPNRASGGRLWVGHCRPRMSAIPQLNLRVSFPAVSSRGRRALADPEETCVPGLLHRVPLHLTLQQFERPARLPVQQGGILVDEGRPMAVALQQRRLAKQEQAHRQARRANAPVARPRLTVPARSARRSGCATGPGIALPTSPCPPAATVSSCRRCHTGRSRRSDPAR